MRTTENINYFAIIRANIKLLIGPNHRDISLRTLADNAEIDFSNFLSFINEEGKDIKLSTIIKLAAALGVTPQQLFVPMR